MRIVIIGGGPGGYEAALVAAEHDADVTLVSSEGLGGNSVLWDCVPSKALIVSSEAMGWVQSAHRLGVRHTAGADIAAATRVDLAAVMQRVGALASAQSDDIARKVTDAGVRRITGHGRLADAHTVTVTTGSGSEDLPADVIVLATGSDPRILPFAVPDAQRIFTSRELYSLTELPERLIVIGSGATGAEYAQAFAKFGADVHLISSRAQVLPREDPDAAAVIEDVFESWGMTIHRQRRALDLEHSADGIAVRVGEDAWVEGSHVLSCVGQVPSIADVGLDAAGVITVDGAIAVDGVSRTNVPTIYAAGDVTGGTMLASVAAMQGRTAMWHALGLEVAPLRRDTIAGCIFTSPEVATVGLTAEQIPHTPVPVDTVTLRLAGNPRAKMAEHTEGFVKIHSLVGSGTVLGGAVVAAGASDLITPLSVAVANRLTVRQLAHAFTVYPTMGGSVQESARLLMDRSEVG